MGKGYTKEERKKFYDERLGLTKTNKYGDIMTIVIYNGHHDIVVEFQDEARTRVHSSMANFYNGVIKNPNYRLGEKRVNNQGCLMVIVEYVDANNMTVEFQDKYQTKIHASYKNFNDGNIKNPYYPSVYGVGMVGVKYPTGADWKNTQEYKAWNHMLERCYSEKLKNNHPTYKDVTCCEEWLLFENFYEWLHSQENFNKWLNGDRWALDKDILVKGNKIYSPKTCCLVPPNINSLFTKRDRGELPIGVKKSWNRYEANCVNPFTNKREYIGRYDTVEAAFQAYRFYKENIIKQVAQIEYDKGNITKQCYGAMMNYEVEITD